MSEKEWYTNKDLFEQINRLTQDMKETRATIKKYNGLYEKVGIIKDDVDEIKAVQKGRNSVGTAIRSWGGWIFGLISLIVLLMKF